MRDTFEFEAVEDIGAVYTVQQLAPPMIRLAIIGSAKACGLLFNQGLDLPVLSPRILWH